MADKTTDSQTQLKCLYADLEKEFLDFDNVVKEKVNTVEPDFIGKVRLRLKDLEREHCGIVIAGEACAGKTLLMNLIVGKEIMKPNNLPSTENIYRVHNSEELKIVFSTLEGKEENQETFSREKELLKRLKEGEERKICIDIFLPLPSLKGDIVLIDTPGVGGNDEYNKILLTVIPQAVGFVFVANLGSAGGFQEGRLLKIFNDIKTHLGQMPCFDPKDVIFLLNKYDQIDEHEREEIMGNTKRNLHDVWPYVALADENMMYISLKQVAKDKKGKKVNNEFQTFRETLSDIIEKNSNKRFKEHGRYLEMLLKAAITTCDTNIQWQKKRFQANKLKEDARKLRQECVEKVNELSNILTSKSEELADICHTYLTSKEVERKILKDSQTLYKNSDGRESEANTLLRTHFIQCLESWCSGEIVQTTIKEIENRIQGFMRYFEKSIEDIFKKMTGKKFSASPIAPFDFKKIVEEFANRFPKATAFSLSLMVNISWYFGFTSSEERLKRVLRKILSECSYAKLASSFKQIFMLHFIPRIDSSVEFFLKSLGSIDEILLDVENIENCSVEELEKMVNAVDTLRKISERLMIIVA